MTELFDLYLLHVYLDFADPGTAGAVGSSVGGHSTSPGASAPGALHAAADVDGLSPRLRAILQHVIVGSIGKHRALLVNNKPGSKLSRVLAAPTAKSTSAGGGEGGGAARSGANGPGAQPHASPGVNGLTHSGNLYGVVERFAAADSLLTAARHLAAAVPLLEAALPVGDATAAAAFAERAVGAAEDLRGVVLARGCRLMLPLGWVPEAVAAGAYQANEPPSIAAQWTQQLGRQLELFAAQIEGVEELPEGAPAELWTHAAHAVATAVVEGLSKVRRCTLEGRAAMSLDLQALAHALGRVHPAGSGAETGALRLVDDYIKAFYVSLDDLPAWAAVHRQYSSKHVLALAACIAESKGLRRRELAAAVAKVEAALEAAALL